MMSRKIFVIAAVLMLGSATSWVSATVLDTAHNLSTSGTGTVRASSESQVCIFCHTPHSARPSTPLWNRADPGTSYTPYSSSTAIASPGQPNGSSLMCLSCHDGTIALGQVISLGSPISMQGGVTTIPSGPGRLGTDLSDDHPISFVYSSGLASSNGELQAPGSLPSYIKLDGSQQLQCTSCHDPHDNANGSFLVRSNQGGALCNSCHIKDYWSGSIHASSNATWDNSSTDPWPNTEWTTVADNACQNCHQPHNAGEGERLLNYSSEEANCYACHNGHVANENVQSIFNNRTYTHPVDNTTGTHDPGENNVVPGATRHVECVDCHNPHGARSGSGTVSGNLTGVRGVTINGGSANPATHEYEICLRCHGDSTGKPSPYTQRQLTQTNVRQEFVTTNPSYHPVAGPGANSNVPSLISLSENDTIACTDCHNNDGSGPRGPHGSNIRPLLAQNYVTADFTNESPSNYALCYSCHSRSILMSNNSSFPLHQKHVQGENAPCNACHDPHGVQGNAQNHTHLINFDTNIVNPSPNGLRFEDTGDARGRCYLSCHGQNHNPCSYGSGMGGMGGMCGMGGMGG